MPTELMFYNQREMENIEGECEMKEIVRASLETILVLLLGLALIIVSLSFAPGAAGAGTNPYPYAKSTYWAWQNRPDLPANLGEAKDWDDNAEKQGWPVGLYPRHGDIAVFEPGVYGADLVAGHVAVVAQVYDDGTYRTTQMDESDCKYDSSSCGRINERVYSIVQGTRFIHYKKDTRTTWGFASGASGWTAKDLGAGNMGGPGWFYPLAGADPQLVSPELDIPLDSYNAVEVTMVTGVPVTDPAIQVYFATASAPGFTEANSVKAKAMADGQLHTYRAYFGDNPAWKGQLARLRLDPAGPGNSGGVRIDRVRLVSVEGSAEKFTTLTEPKPPTLGPGRSNSRI
jgi:surface antigen